MSSSEYCMSCAATSPSQQSNSIAILARESRNIVMFFCVSCGVMNIGGIMDKKIIINYRNILLVPWAVRLLIFFFVSIILKVYNSHYNSYIYFFLFGPTNLISLFFYIGFFRMYVTLSFLICI